MPAHRYAKYGLAAVAHGAPDYDSNDLATSVTDALANIMHYCDAKGIDFDAALDSARTHHAAETGGEQD